MLTRPQIATTHVNPLVAIQTLSSHISQESLMVDRPNKHMISRLRGLFDDTLSFVDTKMRSVAALMDSTGFMSSSKELEIDYLHVMDLDVPVPKGLSVTYVEYAQLLHSASKVADVVQPQVLLPFSQYISTLVSTPAKMGDRSLRSNIKVADTSAHDTELKKALSSNHTTRPLAKVIKRGKDFAEIDALLDDMLKGHQAYHPAAIRKMVDDIDDILEVLFDKLEDDNASHRATGTAVKNLSSLAKEVADAVNFYANYTAQLLTFKESYAQTRKLIQEHGE